MSENKPTLGDWTTLFLTRPILAETRQAVTVVEERNILEGIGVSAQPAREPLPTPEELLRGEIRELREAVMVLAREVRDFRSRPFSDCPICHGIDPNCPHDPRRREYSEDRRRMYAAEPWGRPW